MSSRVTRGHWIVLAIHAFIIVNFLAEIAYASYLVFVVIAPDGGGPLFDQASSFPHEKMVTRRLYAAEAWIAISGLSIYLAITEIGPRLRQARSESPS